MASETAIESKPSPRERLLDELYEFGALSAYLFVCFATLLFFKSTIAGSGAVHYVPLGTAAVKAAICAKFILMGLMLSLGRRFSNHPLILPTLYKSLVFLLVLIVLTIIEEVIVGLIHDRSFSHTISELGGATFGQLVATCAVVMLILVPYFGFRTLGELVGERNLIRLFFERRR